MNLVAAVALVLAQGRGVDSLAGRVRQLADSYLAAYFERHRAEARLAGAAAARPDRLPADSPLALAAWQAREDAWLAELRAIDPAPFGGRPEAVAYGVMRDALEGAIATRVCRHELWNVGHTGNGAIAIVASLSALQPVGTELARRQTLARWRAIPAYLASEEENQRTGLRLGFSAPRGNVRITLTQLDSLLGTPLERSPLLDPARRDSTPAFRVELERVLTTDVLPAARRYRDFLERDYLPRARSAMLDAARRAVLRAKAAMPAWFGRLPRADIVVEPYPAFRERESVGEWNPPAEDGSRPGIYFLSTYDPIHKARADLEALTFHETIPGHHLQGSIALERGQAIPAIARYFWSPGFGEGWAEYAEQLADEMGLYSSDTARLGALADITLSAALLVVDTGINAFGWTREQGIAYIRDHTRVPRLRAAVPVDRYPIWPAQGLSYALGRLEIRRLRAAATRALGSRFDVRAFHDRVLADGAVPLPLLRKNIERWIAAAR